MIARIARAAVLVFCCVAAMLWVGQGTAAASCHGGITYQTGDQPGPPGNACHTIGTIASIAAAIVAGAGAAAVVARVWGRAGRSLPPPRGRGGGRGGWPKRPKNEKVRERRQRKIAEKARERSQQQNRKEQKRNEEIQKRKDARDATASRGRRNDARRGGDRVTGRDPVDLATGELVMAQTDFEFPGILAVILKRTHISSYDAGRAFGRSWASTVDQRLEVDDDGLVFRNDDGMRLDYPEPVGDSVVMPLAGPRWPLSRTPEGGYAIDQPDAGHRLLFAPGGNVRPLMAITDRPGHRIVFRSSPDGLVKEVAHSGGYRVAVAHDGDLVTELRLAHDDGGHTALVRFGYDENRRLTEVINSSGRALRFGYDDAGRITSWTDRNGNWYRYVYDDPGRVVRVEGTDGALSGVLWYGEQVTVQTDSLGQRTAHHFNGAGQLVREVDPLGHATVFDWDAQDGLLAWTDPLGRTTGFGYDDAGNLIAVAQPDGSRVRVSYHPSGLPTEVVEPDGATWRYGYDERGSLVAETDTAGATTRYGYDERGHLSSVTDALGGVTTIETDDAGLPIAVTDPLGAATRYDRDDFGRVTAITDPVGGVTRFSWSVDGRLLARTLPGGSSQRWRYDPEGNQVEHVDPLGNVTRTEYGPFGVPTAHTGPDRAGHEFGYDTELRLVSVTNPQGLVWRYDYDPAGNLARETDFNNRVLHYAYDAAGQLIARRNGAGEVAEYDHDAAGNVVRQNAGGSVTTFSYDPAGRLLRAANQDADLGYQYDPLGRVVAETVNGRTVGSVYDPLGRRTARRTPSGVESVWEYNAGGQPVALHTAGQTLTFGYDPAGREVERALGPAARLTQRWDSDHRLSTQAIARDNRVTWERRLSYRADGLLSGIDDHPEGARQFELDQAGRVTSVRGPGGVERYSYDPAGNITAATVPPPHPASEERSPWEYAGTLISRAGDSHYLHDPQGRVVMRELRDQTGRHQRWHYKWDADDRLIAVITPDEAYWRYLYDPLGRRIAKLRLAPDGNPIERLDFTWDGCVMAEQLHSSGAAITWDWDPGGVRPITQVERSLAGQPPGQADERLHALVTDVVGTPTEMVDVAGNVVWRPQSTLWGMSPTGPGPGPYCPLRFPGQYHDTETGLYYNVFRYYDPTTGRYLSADPLGLVLSPNPHAYVPNPTALTDPLGLGPGEKMRSTTRQRIRNLRERAEIRGRTLHRNVDEYQFRQERIDQALSFSDHPMVPVIPYVLPLLLRRIISGWGAIFNPHLPPPEGPAPLGTWWD